MGLFNTQMERTMTAYYGALDIQEAMKDFKLPSGESISFDKKITKGRRIACNPTIRMIEVRGTDEEQQDILNRMIRRSVESLERQLTTFYGDKEKINVSDITCLTADEVNTATIGWIVYLLVEDDQYNDEDLIKTIDWQPVEEENEFV